MLKDWSCCLLIESCFCDIVTQTQTVHCNQGNYILVLKLAAPLHAQLWLHVTSVSHMPSACKHTLLVHPGELIGLRTVCQHILLRCLYKHCFALDRCYMNHK